MPPTRSSVNGQHGLGGVFALAAWPRNVPLIGESLSEWSWGGCLWGGDGRQGLSDPRRVWVAGGQVVLVDGQGSLV